MKCRFWHQELLRYKPTLIFLMLWTQKTLRLKPFSNGIHSITQDVIEAIPEIREIESGLLNIFLQHTSASITINENADPDVQTDLGMVLHNIVPESLPYDHTLEGDDDMPAHVKSSMLGVSLNIPISKGKLALGTWQGIYLCEHRRSVHHRTIILTVFGKKIK